MNRFRPFAMACRRWWRASFPSAASTISKAIWKVCKLDPNSVTFTLSFNYCHVSSTIPPSIHLSCIVMSKEFNNARKENLQHVPELDKAKRFGNPLFLLLCIILTFPFNIFFSPPQRYWRWTSSSPCSALRSQPKHHWYSTPDFTSSFPDSEKWWNNFHADAKHHVTKTSLIHFISFRHHYFSSR